MRMFVKKGSTHMVVLYDSDKDIKKYEDDDEYIEMFESGGYYAC